MKEFEVKNTNIIGLKVINEIKKKDKRGFLVRKYNFLLFKRFCKKKILHINHVHNNNLAIIRGMHLQKKPFVESKIVSCLNGKIFDVIVDLRKKSKTFGNVFTIKISGNDNISIFIPEGCAHGYQTLTKKSDLLYFHTEIYSKNDKLVLNPFDKNLNIKWPIKKNIIVSDDDLKGEKLCKFA